MSGADDELEAPPPRDGGTGPSDGSTGSGALDYRQLQQPVDPLSVHELMRLGGTGAGSVASELSDTLKSFGGKAIAALNTNMAAKGTSQGTAAGADPGFQPKTGLAAMTSFGSAYNAAGAVSYRSQAELNATTAIESARQAYSGDTQGFLQQAQAIREGSLKETPDAFKPEMAVLFDRHIQAATSRVQDQETADVHGQAVADWQTTQAPRFQGAVTAAAALAASGRQDQSDALIAQTLYDDKTSIVQLGHSGALSPAQVTEQLAKSEASMASMVHANYHTGQVDQIMSVARAGDLTKADQLIHAYEQNPDNSDADKLVIRHDYEEQRKQFTEEQGRLHADDLADVSRRLAETSVGPGESGDGIEATIKQLHKIGAMGDTEYVSNLKHVYENQESSVKRDAVLGTTDDRLHGIGPPLDSKSPEDARNLDTWWQHQPEYQNEPAGSDRRVNALINIAHETGGMLPESERTTMRIGLSSQDPKQVVAAALNAQRLQAAIPRLNLFNDPKKEVEADTVARGVQNGIDPVTAITLARNASNRSDGDQKRLDSDYGKLIKANPNSNAAALNDALSSDTLRNQIPSGFLGHKSTPDAPPAMVSEFNGLVKSYYDNSGDLAQSQKLAGRALLRTWGVTQVNGTPELVKHPIEQTTNTPVSTIRSDLAASAKAAGFNGDASNLHLIPDPVLGDRGVANVEHLDPETGVRDTLRDSTGRVLQYVPPQSDRLAVWKAQDDAATERRIQFREQRKITGVDDDAVQRHLQNHLWANR